jgi:predicted extracellular nuclease
MATPLAGHTVTTQGVVIGDYEGAAPNLRGFYIQDPIGDDDPETSDGIFVSTGTMTMSIWVTWCALPARPRSSRIRRKSAL